ncbi:YHS domain-containing (seleno)protein [uncultured Paracoccus sp.]|uniref:YHS domain-containing (seleno)protein n=1 Tax=uncultured Paracoccus sp. TaxID=189685 RepID=UPI00262AAED8|nr:YHS domain-containing (seleno)protein [uncultured Paracoccus sp.]
MKTLLFSLFALLTPIAPVHAQDWALGGFDPVGYQAEGRAVPGRNDISTLWQGMVWHFATVENRAMFEADPRSYAPGLNGLCPVALSRGRSQPGDPRHFVIVGQRVYLLGSDDNQRSFMKDPRAILMQARKVWASLQ